jgi:hypothetical protein
MGFFMKKQLLAALIIILFSTLPLISCGSDVEQNLDTTHLEITWRLQEVVIV